MTFYQKSDILLLFKVLSYKDMCCCKISDF
nr:MAG TPA: hypothetical protein [Caudoviricetes sp.]